jgi:hypothetical protein
LVPESKCVFRPCYAHTSITSTKHEWLAENGMLSHSHGRICILAAFCLVVLFLTLTIRHSNWLVSKQFSGGGHGIGNSTLGVRYFPAVANNHELTNAQFEAIFAINAPWRTDRKDSLTLAAVHSGISLNWIDGVNASSIDDRAYPQGDRKFLPKGNLGSWRAHMNAIRT